jgi:hypothetical protein
MEADDIELLREYARAHSEQAFRTLVERHIGIVYAVALRQTGDAQLAEDVTQAVFIVLSERRPRFRRTDPPAGSSVPPASPPRICGAPRPAANIGNRRLRNGTSIVLRTGIRAGRPLE